MELGMQDAAVSKLLLIQVLQQCENAIVVGTLDQWWLKRFELANMMVIDLTYDMNQLQSKFANGQRGCILLVNDEDDVPSDIKQLFSNVIHYQAPKLPPCMEWCKEQYTYTHDFQMPQSDHMNAEDDTLCSVCNKGDLFSCIYDPDQSSINYEMDIDYSDCRKRCTLMNDGNNIEHQELNPCQRDGKTWYEKFGFIFTNAAVQPTFRGKLIQ